jgi:hypothetical protein
MRLIDPSDFLTGHEVLNRWPMLTRAELRRARKARCCTSRLPPSGRNPWKNEDHHKESTHAAGTNESVR